MTSSAARRRELAAGLGIVGAQLADHVGEVLVVDPADALEVGGAALRQQVEIVDQPRHRRVVAVGGLGLQREAFGERPRADAGRVEALDDRQRLLDQRQRRAGQLGDLLERDGQIAGLVERFGDDPREVADVARTRRAAGRCRCSASEPAEYSTPVEIEGFLAAA